MNGPGAKRSWQFLQQPRTDDHDPAAFVHNLARLLHPLKRFRFHAHVMVAAPESYLHHLTIRVSEARQIPEALQERLPSLLPFELELAQVQFHVSRQHTVEDHVEAEVTVAACERAALLQEIEVFWDTGWVPTAVVPPALALVETARALGLVDPEPRVFVEIGEHRTTIVLMEEGKIIYARDVALGDEQLTEALMRQVSIGERTHTLSREEAVTLKQRLGVPLASASSAASDSPIPIPTYVAMIQPVLEQLVTELRRTMAFGAPSGAVSAPPHIFLSGEGAQLPHCDTWLAQQLNVIVTRLSCESLIGAEGSASAVVCGLALLPHAPALDLQPVHFRRQGMLVRLAARSWRALVLAALILWFGAGVWMLRLGVTTRELRTLDTRWQRLQPAVAMQKAMEQQTHLITRLTVEQGLTSEWFRRLTRDFPGAVRLTQLSIDAKHQVRLVGEVQERDQNPEAMVSQLAIWLEQAAICRAVHLESTRRMSAGGNLATFAMTCRLP